MNLTILMGRLAQDPVLRSTTSGSQVANFELAVARRNDPQTADFFKIVCWEKQAELVMRYLKKGRKISVLGYLKINRWTDKEGVNRKDTQVVADRIYFADSNPDYTAENAAAPAPQETPGGFVPVDDSDLPF